MMQMIVLGVALVPRLRPAAHLVTLGFRPLDLFGMLQRVAGEDEYPRRVGVRDDRCVPGVLVGEQGQRVQIRLGRDRQPMLGHRRGERDRLEEIGAGTREHREALRGAIHAVHIAPDFLYVAVEAFSLRTLGGEGCEPVGEFLPQECVELVAPVLVRLQVQIEADNRERAGIPRG